MDEKTYLEQNPDKHKMNLYCSMFLQLIGINGKKFKEFNLDKCVKFNKTFGEDKFCILTPFNCPFYKIKQT